AYLKQHEAHANENKMMLERFTQPNVDPLTLMSSVSHQQYYLQSSTTPPSIHVQPHFADNTQLDPGTKPQFKTTGLVFRMFRVDRIEVRGTMQGVQVQLVMGELRTELGMQIQVKLGRLSVTTATNRVALDEEQLLFIAGGQDNAVDEDVDEQPVQDLALNVDNVFQADDCDAFDSDVDEAPTAQTMFMANLSSADPVYDEASPSYDSDILSEVPDHDNYQDVVCEHHEVHEMHDDVQPNYVVDSHADYTSDSNMIPYDQYVKDNAVPVVQSNVSSVPNDAYMMILNDMHEQSAQYVSVTTHNNVVDKSLTAELATYKEQVELYERRAKFELTEREQKIEEQLRIVITDRNIKEENLKKELHSVKMQLTSTINHNKSMVEEVTSLKKDFKQKENKYLEEFLDMKAFKEKKKVAIGYKNPLCLTRAKQVQPTLYNGHEIIKTNHVPAIVHNLEDTLEIAETTRKKMNKKMKDPECVKKKVTIAPHDYSKENYLATFTPQKQLTPEQIFWSKDLIKMKAGALKEQTTTSRPIKALTVELHQLDSLNGKGVLNKPRNAISQKSFYFLKHLKDHFEGIQKALTKEIKEMKEIFKELKAEVDQNVINKKHDEIERKNILIANDNLIVDCLSKEVFYIATNSELTVSDSLKCMMPTLLFKHVVWNLKQSFLNYLKYQNLKERFGNNTSLPAQDDPDFDSVFTRSEADRTLDFRALDFQITQLTKKVTVLQEQNELFRAENEKVLAPGRYAIDVEPIPPRNRNNRDVHLDYLKHLKESVETLREIVEEAKVERPLDSSLASACFYTKHSQELLEYVIGTCPKDFNPRDKHHASTPLTRKKQITFDDQCETSNNNTHKHVERLNIQKTNVPVINSTGVNSCTNASGLNLRSNTKKNRISPAKSVHKKKV
ncbi:hypothetical protein Tco_1129389, partial [Tanacetum coccineum]